MFGTEMLIWNMKTKWVDGLKLLRSRLQQHGGVYVPLGGLAAKTLGFCLLG